MSRIHHDALCDKCGPFIHLEGNPLKCPTCGEYIEIKPIILERKNIPQTTEGTVNKPEITQISGKEILKG